ncbi:MAG: hypothetical protein HKM98_09330, partial [Gammaproteobacteria bacterium]|nr:hypothetical protein [Gammaproteobacteria bacterium]
VTVFLFVQRLGVFVWDRSVLAMRRQRNGVLRQSQRQFKKKTSNADDIDKVWSALVDVVSDLDAARLELTPAAGIQARQWQRKNTRVATLVVQRAITTTDGELRITWDDGRTLLAAEEGGVLDKLVDTMDQKIMPRLVSLNPA